MGKMTAMHFYGWEKGLKTGQYYLRSRPARDAIKFTVNMEALIQAAEEKDETKILEALEKVDKIENEDSKVKSVNLLGKKSVGPRGGLSSDVKQSPPKNQKQEESEEEDQAWAECENCGS